MSAFVARMRSAAQGELVAFLVLSGILVASVLWHPLDEGGFVICPFRRATGLPCPGCGLTRSFCAIAKGHVERGFEFHSLGPALFIVLCVYWLRSVAFLAGSQRAVDRFDETVRRWRLMRAGVLALLVAWAIHLVALGYAGQLGALAREGIFFRSF
jgi:uncharacterized protein DUF2752